MKELLAKTAPNYIPRNIPKVVAENLTLAEMRQIVQEIAQEDGVEIQSQLKSFETVNDSILIEKIFSMRWQFFVAPADLFFLTGDNPVHWPKKLGLKHKNAELAFPVSSKVCLVTSWRMNQEEKFIKATPHIIKKINRRIAGSTLREVYCCQSCEWVAKLLNRDEHEYRSIY